MIWIGYAMQKSCYLLVESVIHCVLIFFYCKRPTIGLVLVVPMKTTTKKKCVACGEEKKHSGENGKLHTHI